MNSRDKNGCEFDRNDLEMIKTVELSEIGQGQKSIVFMRLWL